MIPIPNEIKLTGKAVLKMDKYTVRPLRNDNSFTITVPGSKSITNRALLLAAMCRGSCTLNGVLFSDDSRAFLSCLKELGYSLSIDEERKAVTIEGTGGSIPKKAEKNAYEEVPSLHVGSAGTAARFLTVFLAFAGGRYSLDASPQMRKRPMEPLLSDLRKAGVKITCTGEDGHFPFVIESDGISVSEMTSNTDVSSQFASALIMAAPLLENGLRLKLEGSRTNGSYIKITLGMMSQFGFKYRREGDTIIIRSGYSEGSGMKWQVISPESYDIEPDMSAACYFYAMTPICGRTMQVRGVHPDSMQGDYQFIRTLEKLGCTAADAPEGIVLSPPADDSYPGIELDMKDYSDQTMTMAVTAAFAGSPTTIRNIGHIRFQESDRLHAVITELNRLGCGCIPIDDDTGLYIEPRRMHGADIETYEDHRMAMAFSLIGLRVSGVTILNPLCCRKTFENFFDVIDSITVQPELYDGIGESYKYE
jgi:3-phosphoshikimate 1-carboxyvinyltransferase